MEDTTLRNVTISLSVALVVLTTAGAVAFALAYPQSLAAMHLTMFGLLGIVVGGFAAVALVAALISALTVGVDALIYARNERVLAPYTLSRVELDGETVRTYRRRVKYRGLRRPIVAEEFADRDQNLSDIHYATWSSATVSPIGMTITIQFWDRDPLECARPGARQADNGAVLVWEVDDDFFATTEGSKPVLDYFAAKAAVGQFRTNVDMATGDFMVVLDSPGPVGA